MTSVIGLHDVCKDDNYNIADSGIALSSTYNVIREENLHDRRKSLYDVILTEDLSDISSGVYDVARKENMNDSADATRSPYVVVSSEYLPPPGYESVTATTSPISLLPLPPPMIRESSEAPSLPAPYNSGVDTLLESVINGSVQNDVVVTKDESRQGDVFSNENLLMRQKTKDDIDDDGQEQKVIVEVSR